jgi:hypothetical protein
MSWPAIVMYLVVACVGLPAAFRNPTALALVVAWLVPEILYQFTGNSLPLSVYFMADITVIAVICAKAAIGEGCSTYPTLRQQFACFWRALTACDRTILGLFLFGAWPVYVSNLHPYYAWFALWAIAIAQFMLAGVEALVGWHQRRKADRKLPDNVFLFAPAYARKSIGAEPIPTSSVALSLNVGKVENG